MEGNGYCPWMDGGKHHLGITLFMWPTCQTIHRSTFYCPLEISIRKYINTRMQQQQKWHVHSLIQGRRKTGTKWGNVTVALRVHKPGLTLGKSPSGFLMTPEGRLSSFWVLGWRCEFRRSQREEVRAFKMSLSDHFNSLHRPVRKTCMLSYPCFKKWKQHI